MGQACDMYGRNAYRILNGKPEEERSLWRPWNKCKNIIKISLK
jgi:hypothetical protein